MAKKVQKKVVKVRAHTMRVPVSPKNPEGVTIRDEHPRRLKGTYLDPEPPENKLAFGHRPDNSGCFQGECSHLI